MFSLNYITLKLNAIKYSIVSVLITPKWKIENKKCPKEQKKVSQDIKKNWSAF